MIANFYALISGKVKSSTKILVGLILGFPALMQIDAVKNFITPIVAAHPKVASGIAAVTLISTLLHSPQFQAILGIQETQKKVTSPDGSVTTEKTATVIEQK